MRSRSSCDIVLPTEPHLFGGVTGDGYLDLACAVVAGSAGDIEPVWTEMLDKATCPGLSARLIEMYDPERSDMEGRNRLKEIRKEQGLTQMQLTVQTGVATSTISAIEKHSYQPTAEVKQRLADALSVSVDAIWPQNGG